MTNGGVEQIQLILQTELFQVRACCGVHLCALTAVFHIDLIHILHQLDCLCLADIFIQSSAKIIGDIVLSVRESACTAKPAHDRTALALDTALYLLSVNRAAPPVKRMPCLEHCDFYLFFLLQHLIRRKNSTRTCPYYDHVVMHCNTLAFSF